MILTGLLRMRSFVDLIQGFGNPQGSFPSSNTANEDSLKIGSFKIMAYMEKFDEKLQIRHPC